MSLDYYKNLANEQVNLVPNLPKLQKIKELALKDFNDREIPNRKNEDWKYTNLTKAFQEEFTFGEEQESSVQIVKDPHFFNLVFINGSYRSDLSEDIQGIDLNDTLESLPEELQALVEKTTPNSQDFSQVMNKAFLNSGYIINLNTTLEKPLLIHQYYNIDGQIKNQTNFIKAAKNSQNTVVEKFYGPAKILANISSYSFIEANGKLEHHVIQDSHYGSVFLHQVNCSVSKDAHFSNTYITTGSKISRSNLYIDLTNSNAECDIHGLYALHKEQHCDTQSYIHHNAPYTYSRQLYKGIMTDTSRGVFTGKVRVEKDSQLINAEQLNKNLILSPKAHANSRPQLEIYADDVKCSHGSTTGQINQDELFYFAARGVSEERAKQLLAKAFAQDVVMKIQNTI